MSKYCARCLILIALLGAFTLASVTRCHQGSEPGKQLLFPIDLIPNWTFAAIEPGGWEGNDHNASKPSFWYFAGDTNGPKEQYRVINDTNNDGDADTLFLQPTQTNQAHTIMFWQDFIPVDINHVTIHCCSRATGPSAVLLLYGLNATVAPDTPLPNGSLPCLMYCHPYSNETPGYWPSYTNTTISLSNLTNTYHHYRIHWQIIEAPGKPDAQLYITYCRITEPQPLLPPLPPIWAIPGIHAIIILVTGIIISIIMILFYLKQKDKLHFPKIGQ